jgi:hypothetical protein
MQISFDPDKNEANIQTRGLPFALVGQLDWSSAIIEEDLRHDYGEHRYLALGHIEERLYAVVFTPRAGLMHVISLRKANAREVNTYAKQT